MKIGPHLGGIFDGILSGKTKGAFGPTSPSGLLMHIEERKMSVGVLGVVAVLVVDGCNIPSCPFAQPLRKRMRQSFSLLR